MNRLIKPFPHLCLALVAIVLTWSGIHPADRLIWWLEVAPILIAAPLLIATYSRFRWTNLAYALIAVHMIVLAIGGHYTYAQVPLFDTLKEWFNFSRNHYDRVGHFMQGFTPALVARELLLRTSPLKPGKWLVAIILLSCLGISAAYELIEWIVAIASDTGAETFLAMQGDVWDTQKDMCAALIGGISCLLLLSKVHDKQLSARR